MSCLHLSTLYIMGLPWTAWLLWLLSVGLGLAVVAAFYLNRRRDRRPGEDE